MQPARGIQYLLYGLSSAGFGLVTAALAAGGLIFFHPPLELVKNGLPRFLAPDTPAAFPLLALAGLVGVLAFLCALPAAAVLASRDRAGLSGRRFNLLAALVPLALGPVFLFLPPLALPSPLNAVFVFFFAAVTGAGAACYLPSLLSLGLENPAADGERVTPAAIQTAGLFGGAIAALFILPEFFTLFPSLGPAGSFRVSYLFLTAAAAALLGASFFAGRNKPGGPAPAARREPFVPLVLRSVRTVVRLPPVPSFLRADACAFFALCLLGTAALPTGRDLMLAGGELLRLTAIVFLTVGVLTLPFVQLIVKRLGKKNAMFLSLGGLAVGLLLLAATGLLPSATGLRWNCATTAAQAGDGTVYVGTLRGVSTLKDGVWGDITRQSGLIDDRINSIVADERGVWFATAGGASLFDGKTWTHFSRASGLIDNRVLDVIPRGNAVWFLTPNGVSLLNNAEWVQYAPGPADPKENDVIRLMTGEQFEGRLTAFALGPQGDLWIGTTDGAFRLSEIGWTEFNDQNGLKDDTITSLAIAADGTVAVGTFRGVARLAPDQTWSYLTAADGLPSDAVRKLAYAPDGRLFVATTRGVFAADGAPGRVLGRAAGPASDRVNDILFARDGSTWLITDDGVAVLAGGTGGSGGTGDTGDRWTTHQYALPWIWGLILAGLLAFPVALFLSLSLSEAAGTAALLRPSAGDRGDSLTYAVVFLARTAVLLAALLVGLIVYTAGGESVANPVPVRLVLILAALAAGTGVFLRYLYPELERPPK